MSFQINRLVGDCPHFLQPSGQAFHLRFKSGPGGYFLVQFCDDRGFFAAGGIYLAQQLCLLGIRLCLSCVQFTLDRFPVSFGGFNVCLEARQFCVGAVQQPLILLLSGGGFFHRLGQLAFKIRGLFLCCISGFVCGFQIGSSSVAIAD